ncbi:hypothetical protein FPOAC1_007541 [Fusarium poae]|uniref:hypothetical protein n=1 Tax=Fusarium poae TaxID=36050 RepID=UPI001CEBFF4D|nr:hypothetical protein FPOAC1_007541 [Fusarium poae]KAG8668166.1 hypothetical protein FPOAC1_007541 [Fusarium poae]
MRLINVETVQMRQFSGTRIPPYAILSHRWGDDKEEVSFSDMKKGSSKKVGMAKVRGCCKQAKKDGIKYIWIDSCCINKDSSKELDEAINSMFQWYQKAKFCYTYMSDVPKDDKFREPGSKFYSSSWFQRGWTLQELLAPAELRFYDQEWNLLDTKAELVTEIENITKIPKVFLLGWDFRRASVAQRMSWAAKRETKREEDMAYCLLGIFNISMPMIYGEGRKAFERLQLKIIEQTSDDSILAWGICENNVDGRSTKVTKPISAGVFASSPKDFSDCGRIVPHDQNSNPSSIFTVSGGYVHTSLTLHYNKNKTLYAGLNCRFQDDDLENVIAIPLYTSSSMNGYIRPQKLGPVVVEKPPVGHPRERFQIRVDRQISPVQARGTAGVWLHVMGYKKLGLKLAETYPPLEWDNSRALLDNNDDSKTRVETQLVRFTSDAAKSHDVIVVIERNPSKCPSTMRSFIIQALRDLELADIEKSLPFMNPKSREANKADNGVIEVTVAQTQETVPDGILCFVSLDRTDEVPTVTRKHPAILTAKLKCDFMDSLKKEHLARSAEHPAIKSLATLRDRRDSLENKMIEIEQEEWKLAERKRLVQTEIKSLTDQIVAEEAKTQGRLKNYEKHKSKRLQIQSILDGKTGYSPGLSKPRFLSTKGEVAAGPGNWFEKMIERQLKRVPEKSYSWPVEIGQDTKDLSPLLWAVTNTKTEIVELLVEKGSDTEVKYEHGTTVLSAAAFHGKKRIVEILLRHGAKLEARNENNLTPLIYASYGGRQEVVTLLLDKGAKIDSRTASKSTALGLAASEGHDNVVSLLLDRGANVESKDDDGNTALAKAASRGHAKTAEILIKKGAKIGTRNLKQQTPLAIATKNGHKVVARMLVNAGAKG